MSGPFAESIALAAFLLVGSGWGGVLPGTPRWATVREQTTAGYVIGLLVFGILYLVGAQSRVPLEVARIGTGTFLLVGVCGLWRIGRQRRDAFVAHLAVALVIALFWLFTWNLAGNRGAIDPWYYVASPFLLFDPAWVSANVPKLPDGSDVQAGIELMAMTRAAASAVLWPIALLGIGLGVGSVTQAGLGLLLGGALLCGDLVERDTPRWIGWILGLGGLGVYNAISIASGGQIQQGMALTVLLACTWLGTTGAGGSAGFVAFAFGGFVISATYPEFLIVLPLYVALVTLLRQHASWTTAKLLGAAAIGFGLEQALTVGESLGYLLNQSGASPGWAPLPFTPASPFDAIRDLVLQNRPPAVLLALTLALGVVAWWWLRGQDTHGRAPVHVYWLLGALAVVWAIVLTRSPNLNYAVFKLGGWIGPGLLLVAWWLAGSARNPVAAVARAFVLTLAFVRVAALVYGGNEVLAWGRPALDATWPREVQPDGTCRVQVDTSSAARTLEGIAGSAAPFHECILIGGG